MSSQYENIPMCQDRRDWCKAKVCGKCIALVDTDFNGKDCPFYKRMDSGLIKDSGEN